MRVLVTAASKYGATAEIAEAIGRTLGERGLEVDVRPIDDQSASGESELEGFDAVVLGSAVYAGYWLERARRFAEQHATALRDRPLWLFSSGPVGSPDPKPEGDPEGLSDLVAELGATEHRVFAGKIDKDRLHFGDRAIVFALRAPVGDYRDWEAVADWAASIAESLRASSDSPDD